MRRSPYQGLVPYSEADADWFFGRDRSTEILIDNLRAYRLSIMYGASGVGKSSVLRAGVVRRLAEQAGHDHEPAVVTFSSWSGDDPLGALKQAIRRSVAGPNGGHGPTAGGDLLSLLAGSSEQIGAPLVVILDQFEEYFLYHEHDEGPDSFAEELALALRRRDTPAHFLLSVREDALAKLDRFEGHVPGLLDNLIRIDHLDRKAAQQAIEGPLEQWNRIVARPGEEVSIDPRLRNQILSQVVSGQVVIGESNGRADDPTRRDDKIEAPYLQLVLMRLWAEEAAAGSHVLRPETLERLGGAAEIVRTHLDSTMSRFSGEDQDLAARAFRYLVTPSGTKIAHTPADLSEYTGVPVERLEPVLARLAGDVRVLRAVKSPLDGEEKTHYELFHDTLAEPVLEWRRRIDAERERAAEAARQRAQRRRRTRLIGLLLVLVAAFGALAGWGLVSSNDADTALHNLQRANGKLDAVNARFDAAQQRLRHTNMLVGAAKRNARAANTRAHDALLKANAADERATTAERRARQQSLLAKREQRAAGRARLDATQAQQRAAQATKKALAEGKLATQAQQAASEARAKATKLENEAKRATQRAQAAVQTATAARTEANAARAEAQRQRAAAESARFEAKREQKIADSAAKSALALNELRVDPGGALRDSLAAVEDSRSPQAQSALRQSLAAWRGQAGQPVLAGHTDGVNTASFSPEGSLVVTSSWDKSAKIWNWRTGKVLATLSEPRQTGPQAGEEGVRAAAFSPDGRYVVTGSQDTVVRVWAWQRDPSAPFKTLAGHTAPITSVAFSPDGRYVVTSSQDWTARVWDWQKGVQVSRLDVDTASVTGAAFSPDGRYVVTASSDTTARIWDWAQGKVVATLAGSGVPLRSAAFSPDGRYVVTGGDDNTARVWDWQTGTLQKFLAGHTDAITSATFSPDGSEIVTASRDGTARVWDWQSQATLEVLRGHTNAVNSAAFSPDGNLVVTSSWDHTARIWDARPSTGLVAQITQSPVTGADLSSDGRYVATADADGRARIWDRRSGRFVASWQASTHPLASVAFSFDGRYVVTAGADGANVWDWRNGGVDNGDLSVQGGALDAEFSHDGKYVVTANVDRQAQIWNWRDKVLPVRTLSGHKGAVTSAGFSPDDRLVATSSLDGTARVWNADTGAVYATLEGHTGAVKSAAFSPDGKLVVTGSEDRTARVWNVRKGAAPALSVMSGDADNVNAATFSPSGDLVVSASDDGTARIWDVWSGAALAILPGAGHLTGAAFDSSGKLVLLVGTDGARIDRCDVSVCGSLSELVALAKQEVAQMPASGG